MRYKQVSEFLKTKDFWTLYEEFFGDSQFVVAYVIEVLDFIGIENELMQRYVIPEGSMTARRNSII